MPAGFEDAQAGTRGDRENIACFGVAGSAAGGGRLVKAELARPEAEFCNG
jgi:hypothetical protein